MNLTQYPWANLWIVATVALIGWHVYYMHRKGRLFIFDPLFTFWGGFYICYIKQPLAYADIFVSWHSPGAFEKTLFFSFVGVACVIWGYELGVGDRLARKLPNYTPALDPNHFFIAGLLIAAIGVGDYYFLFKSAGGMWEWLSWGRGGTDYDNVNGYVRELEKLSPIGAYLLILHVRMHPVGRLKKILAWGFGCLLWLWYLYLGTRSRIIGLGIFMGTAYYMPRHKNPNLLLVVPAFVVLIILTNFQASYRGGFTNLSFHLDDIDMEDAKARCLPGFLGGDKELQRKEVSKGIDFNVAMATVDLVPNDVPYNYGWGMMEFVTRPIPRAVWPDKRYPGMESIQGVMREGQLSQAKVSGNDLLMGPAFTFLAFWYYILGPLSVIVGGFYTGILFRTIRGFLERDLRSEGNLIIYGTLTIIGFNEAAATPFGWIYDFPISSIVPLTLLLYLCRKDRREGVLMPVNFRAPR